MEVEVEFEEEEDLPPTQGASPHFPKENTRRRLGAGSYYDGEVDDDDGDAGIDIDVMDIGTPNSFDAQTQHAQGGENRSNSGLGVRAADSGLGGAETEVEGEGTGLGFLRTTRGMRRGGGGVSGAYSSSRTATGAGAGGSRSGAGSPLNADLTDEPDEPMAIESSYARLGEMGMYGDGGGDAGDGIIDVDATIGGKRKR